MIRQQASQSRAPGKGKRTSEADGGPPPSGDLVGTLLEHSGLLVRLLGVCSSHSPSGTLCESAAPWARPLLPGSAGSGSLFSPGRR
jgi:hypothetical protein